MHPLKPQHHGGDANSPSPPPAFFPPRLSPAAPGDLVFSPTPEQTDRILDALADPARTLGGIADEHGASLEQLTRFLARPDIAQRLDDIEQAVARRARLIALNYLPTVAQTLARTLDAQDEEERHALSNSAAANTPHAAELRRRGRETARRAATLLLRLSRHHPLTSPPTTPAAHEHPPTPSLKEGAGGRMTSVQTPTRPCATPATDGCSEPPVLPTPSSKEGAGGRIPSVQPPTQPRATDHGSAWSVLPPLPDLPTLPDPTTPPLCHSATSPPPHPPP